MEKEARTSIHERQFICFRLAGIYQVSKILQLDLP
jgi:hypothetical protein